MKRYNEQVVYREPVRPDTITGVDIEIEDIARDNHTIVQVVLTCDEGGSECGMINRSLKVEVLEWTR